MTRYYGAYRIVSTSRPELNTGLITRHCMQGMPFDPSSAYYRSAGYLGFYRDDEIMRGRGPEFETEQFTVQGRDDTRTWVDVTLIEPLPGCNPDPAKTFGTCWDCSKPLTVEDVTADRRRCPVCDYQEHLRYTQVIDEEGIALMRHNNCYWGPL